jgi:hypothetical protein
MFVGCSSSSMRREETSAATASALSGAGAAANNDAGASSLARYHWLAWNASSKSIPPQAYLAGALDWPRAPRPSHESLYFCRANGAAGVVTSGGGDCLLLAPSNEERTYDVLVADDPDAFQWVNGTPGATPPPNAIVPSATQAAICRAWDDGNDSGPQFRGVDIGVVTSAGCQMLGEPTPATTYLVLPARAPTPTCGDGIISWPLFGDTGTPMVGACEGAYLYTPACYKNAPNPACGMHDEPQPVYNTCQLPAFGCNAWSAPFTTTITIHDDCELQPCDALYEDGECTGAAQQLQKDSLEGVTCTWASAPVAAGHAISVNRDLSSTMCSVTYSTMTWNTGTGPACGIAGYTPNPVPNSCRATTNGFDTPANCGASPQLAPRGLSSDVESQLSRGATAGYPAPKCTTCEDQSDPATKFTCLVTSYQGLAAKGEVGAETAAHIARELKLLFELHGDALIDPAQRAFVLSLYAPPVTSPAQSLARCTSDDPLGTTALQGSPFVTSSEGYLGISYRGSDGSIRGRTMAVGATAWSPESSLGPRSLARPAAIVWSSLGSSSASLVFAQGSDHGLHLYTGTGADTRDDALGGTLASAPAVTSWAPGRLDVFYVGIDGTLRHRYLEEGTQPSLSAEEGLGGALSGDPTAVSWGDQRIDVFARNAADNQLWHEWWDGAWHAELLGGALASSPTVTSWGPSRLDIFWRAADASLHHRAFDQAWQPEEDLGVAIAGDPSATSPEANRVELVALDPSTTQVVRRSWMNGATGALNPMDCTWLDATSDLLCGTVETPAVSVPPACRTSLGSTELQYDQDLTELAACNALMLSHAAPLAVASEVDRCEASIGRLVTQRGACTGGASTALSFQLAKKALGAPLSATALTSDLQSRLGHVQAWWVAQPLATRSAAQASQLVGLIWQSLYALDNQNAASTPTASLVTELSVTSTSLLAAAFPASGTPPLTTAPLGYVVSDALQPLVDRLEQLGAFQDLGCRYAAGHCIASPSTPLTQLWAEIAALGDPTALANAVSAATSVTDPWKTAFANMSSQYAAIASAIADANRLTPPGRPRPMSLAADASLAGGAGAEAPALASLAKEISAATQRMGAYNSIGQLELGPSNAIRAGLQDAKQSDFLGQLETAVGHFQDDWAQYGASANTLLSSLLTELKTKADLQSLADKLNTDFQQFYDETQNLEALRASDAQEELHYADFSQAFQAIASSGAFDPSTKIQVSAPIVATVSAASARWTPSILTLPEAAVQSGATTWKVSGTTGDVIDFQITGQWSPTCALSKATLPDGSHPSLASPPMTGPEGFGISYSGSSYSTVDIQTTDSAFSSSTDTSSDCQAVTVTGGVNVPSGYFYQVSATAAQSDTVCQQETTGSSQAWSNVATNGTQGRTTASFASGLRLSDTPFPGLPAGALVLVQVPAGSSGTAEKILDARVLTKPSASVLVDQASDYYLVVNDDASCGAAASTSPLTITATVLQSVGAKVKQLGQAMASTYAAVRQEVNTLDQQAEVQPDEGALLRAGAYTTLRTTCQCEPTSYPPAILGFFDTWLDKEIVRMERQVDIASAERQQRLTLLDIQGIVDDITANGQQSRIAAQLPDWTLFNLDAAVLGADARSLADFAARYVYPIAALHYPATFTALANDALAQAQLQGLSNVTWDASVETLAATEIMFVKELATAYQGAVNDAQTAGQRLEYAVLGIPNPFAQKTLGAPASPWQAIDTARATQVWRALQSGTTFTLTIEPDDLFNAHGGNAILTCTQAVPIITAMGIYVAEPDSSFGVRLGLTLPTAVDSDLRFPMATGVESFRFVNDAWLGQPVKTYFGVVDGALDALEKDLANATAQAGVSPFTTISVDATALKNEAGNPLATATELDLVFQLDVEPIAAPGLAYLPACQ